MNGVCVVDEQLQKCTFLNVTITYFCSLTCTEGVLVSLMTKGEDPKGIQATRQVEEKLEQEVPTLPDSLKNR